MELGNFSVSLKVQEIGRSFSFYEALGFEPVIGSVEEKWMVLRTGQLFD